MGRSVAAVHSNPNCTRQFDSNSSTTSGVSWGPNKVSCYCFWNLGYSFGWGRAVQNRPQLFKGRITLSTGPWLFNTPYFYLNSTPYFGLISLSPVVQRLDSFIRWINHYAVNKMFWLKYISIRWIAAYPAPVVQRGDNSYPADKSLFTSTSVNNC